MLAVIWLLLGDPAPIGPVLTGRSVVGVRSGSLHPPVSGHRLEFREKRVWSDMWKRLLLVVYQTS